MNYILQKNVKILFWVILTSCKQLSKGLKRNILPLKTVKLIKNSVSPESNATLVFKLDKGTKLVVKCELIVPV